jgi:hypothetical protein
MANLLSPFPLAQFGEITICHSQCFLKPLQLKPFQSLGSLRVRHFEFT